MKAFMVSLRSDLKSGLPFVIWLTLTLVSSLAGPFDTYRVLDFPLRFAFWAMIVGMGVVLGMVLRALVFGVWNVKSLTVGSPIIALILALIFPPIVHLILLVPAFQTDAPLPSWLEIASFTALCSLTVGAFRGVTDQMGEAFAEPESPMPSDAAATLAPRLFDRLLDAQRGDLLSISVRDHYVDVRTTAGTTSLLLRLSDAIAETDGLDGAQVHRSHWVAWPAVVAAAKVGGKLVLTQQDGTTIPVSKTYRALVEERGIGTASTLPAVQAKAIESGAISPDKAGSNDHSPPV